MRAIRLAALAFVGLIASVTSAQHLSAFNHTTYTNTFPENDTGSLALLADAIEGAINSNEAQNFDYDLDARGKARLTGIFTNPADITLSAKEGTGFDYEAGSPFRFAVIGTRNASAQSGHTSGRLEISITITNVDEQPEVLDPYLTTGDEPGRVFYVQRRPDFGSNPFVLGSSVFRDPERFNIQFKPCADDFQVVEYSNLSDPATSTLNRGEIFVDANDNSIGGTAHCYAAPATGTNPAAHDITRGGAVVNVTTLGPTIRITPVAADTAGVRRAVLTFRGWAGTPDLSSQVTIDDNNVKLSPEAKITVYVKTGVNNPPIFGAIGFEVLVNESTDANAIIDIGPPSTSTTAWNATDIDGDALTYRLEGSVATQACRTMAGGTMVSNAVAVGRGCVWLDETALADGSVLIRGRNLDYESAPQVGGFRQYTITLVASDGYNAATDAKVPIHIRVQNVDEGLEFNGPLDAIKQLVVGRVGRWVDLNDYFTDPDGRTINYDVFSSARSVVNASITGSVLTVSPGIAAGSAFVTITATTPGSSFINTQSIQIQVTVRETNRPPEFEQSILTVQVPNPVAESQPTDHIIRLSSLRYSDPDGDTITATILNSTVFEAVVDPIVGDQTYTGEVGIKLIGRLDFEQNAQHRLQIQLSDGWDNSTRTVEVIVDVGNVNEAPVVATDPSGATRTIPPQTVAVNGTGSIDASSYFTDPDRGDRLLITAVTTNPSFATVQVVGSSTVQFTGLLETGATPISVVVTARDLGGLSAQLQFQLNVSANRPPRLVQAPLPQTLTVGLGAQEVSLIGTFVDDDPGDRIVRYEAVSNDDSIVIAQVSNDDLNVVLIPRAEGQTTVDITAYDTRSGSATTSFAVTVLGNSAPILTQRIASVTLRPNGTTTLDVTNYFSDPDGDPLSFRTSVDKPNIATTTLFNNRTLTIQGRRKGTAEVTVTAFDPDGESASTTFLVAVTNEDPIASGQFSTSITYRNDTDTIDVSGNFTDPDQDTLTYSVTVVDDTVVEASIQNAVLSLTAKGIGTTQVTVTGTDPYDASASLALTVTIVNQGPTVVSAIADQATYRDGQLAISLGPHFADADGDELTFTAEVANPRIASVSVQGSDLMLQGIELGSTVVTVTAVDNFGGRITSFFNLEVQNRDPEATMMLLDQTMVRAMPMVIDLSQSFNDPDMDDLTFEVSVEDDTIVEASIDGSMLTTEGVGVGETVVMVTASDGQSGTPATASFTVTVENQAPVVAMEIEDQEIPRQYMAVIDLSMIFEDPDGDPLTFEANIANGAVATTSIQGSTLTVVAETVNSTLITVTASDAYGGSAQDIFRITVVNRAPEVAQAPDDVTLNRTEMPTLDMSMVFSDPDGDTLTLSAESATPGVARVDVNGFNVTLEPLTLGTTEVTLEVADPYNETATTSFNVTVENLAPTVSMTLPNVRMDRVDSVVVDVSGVFVDEDGDAITISAESDDTNLLTTSVSGNSLTLDGVDLGTTNVTVTATDANGATISTSFIVTVVNLDPTVAAAIDAFQLQVGGEPETRDVASAFGDDGPEALVLSVTASGPEVATATVTGMSLTVTPVARGATSVTVTATDAQGLTVEQVVSVSVSDSELKNVANATLASFSRAILSSVSSTVGARLLADSDGLYAPFTSFTLDDFAPSNDFAQSIDGFSNASPFANQSMPWSNTPSPAQSGYGQYRSGDIASMLGRGFSLKLAAAGDPTFWTVWGGADRQSFEASNHEGSTSSYYFGGDMTIQGQWMFGVAVGRNAGNSDYTFGTATQSMDLALTSILPYARMTPSDRTTIYGTIGFGSGEVETSVIGATSDIADLKATIGLLGGRQIVYTMMNGFNLAVVGDFGFANLETDDTPGGAGSLVAETSRFRGGVESSFNLAMGADGSFVPFITVGFRSDSGDDEISDSGVEITGGLRIMNPIFSLDANFRTLATYGADDYSESGFSVMAALNPSAGATGLNISVAPSWGASTVSSNALWQDDFKANRFHEMAAFANLNRESVKWDSYVGYGFLVLHEQFILTPFLDVRTGYSNDQDFSIGAKLIQSSNSKQDLNVDVKIGQDSSMTGTQEESVKVNARLNF